MCRGTRKEAISKRVCIRLQVCLRRVCVCLVPAHAAL